MGTGWAWSLDSSGWGEPLTETRYSQLEREILGVAFAITRFRQYILGRDVQVFTDHKQLIHIIHKPFDEEPPRLQRWLVALMPYQFSLTYKPGHHLVCADAFSRSPLPEQNPTPEDCRGVGEYISMVLEEAPVGISEIQQALKEDPILSSVMQRVLTDAWREYSQSEEPYYLVRCQLTVVDGTLLLGNRYVIPDVLRRPILRLAHPGLEAFQDTWRTRVWWPHKKCEPLRRKVWCMLASTTKSSSTATAIRLGRCLEQIES